MNIHLRLRFRLLQFFLLFGVLLCFLVFVPSAFAARINITQGGLYSAYPDMTVGDIWNSWSFELDPSSTTLSSLTWSGSNAGVARIIGDIHSFPVDIEAVSEGTSFLTLTALTTTSETLTDSCIISAIRYYPQSTQGVFTATTECKAAADSSALTRLSAP
jgi:hypothetical protein